MRQLLLPRVLGDIGAAWMRLEPLLKEQDLSALRACAVVFRAYDDVVRL